MRASVCACMHGWVCAFLCALLNYLFSICSHLCDYTDKDLLIWRSYVLPKQPYGPSFKTGSFFKGLLLGQKFQKCTNKNLFLAVVNISLIHHRLPYSLLMLKLSALLADDFPHMQQFLLEFQCNSLVIYDVLPWLLCFKPVCDFFLQSKN